MAILTKVMRYLETTGMPRSVFGRRSINDPRLVTDLWNGRELRWTTRLRVEEYMAANPERYVVPPNWTRRRF